MFRAGCTIAITSACGLARPGPPAISNPLLYDSHWDVFLTVALVVLLQPDRSGFGDGKELMRSCSVLAWLRQDGRGPR